MIQLEPRDFTERNLATAFRYLSEQFQQPEDLTIIARSDIEKLQRLAKYYRQLNSVKPDDYMARKAIQRELEEASASARSGCYRADYGRGDTDERFYFYPDPDKEDGYAVVLKQSPAKFQPTGNAISDLMRASRMGLTYYVKTFLDQGTDVNTRDKYGYTALFTAALWRQFEVAELLLDRGADVDMRGPNGWTPLICALSVVRLNESALAEMLLRRGANVNAKGDDGETVLMLATKKGQKNIVEELLRRGADASVKDPAGKTALMFAEENHLKEIAEILRKPASHKQ
jgi:hypothetical protein